MRYTTYSKFIPGLADAINLQELMDQLGDFLLQSGFAGGSYNHPFWGEVGEDDADRSMDALRQAIMDALVESGQKGGKGGVFRNIMLGLQFTISIFMLAMVMIIFFQNKKVEDSGDIYPKSQIVTLQRLGLESIQARIDTLRNQLLNVPGVQNVSYTSQLPYQQSNSHISATPKLGDEDAMFMMLQIGIDEHFLDTYNIPLLAGRNLSQEVSADILKEEVLAANILVNELSAEKLGFTSPADAVGKVFYDFPGELAEREASLERNLMEVM